MSCVTQNVKQLTSPLRQPKHCHQVYAGDAGVWAPSGTYETSTYHELLTSLHLISFAMFALQYFVCRPNILAFLLMGQTPSIVAASD